MRELSIFLLAFTMADASAADVPITIKPKAKFNLRHAYQLTPDIRLSADGRRAAIVHAGDEFHFTDYRKGVIQVWDLEPEPKQISEFKAGSYCFELSPSGKRLLTADNFEVYDVVTKKVVAKPVPHSSHAFFLDENTLVLTKQSHDIRVLSKGKITIWNIEKGWEIRSFEVPSNRFSDAKLARGGKEVWLFMGSGNFEVERWDFETGKLIRSVAPERMEGEKPYTSGGLYQSIVHDGTAYSVLIGDIEPRLRAFDPTTGKIIGGLPTNVNGISSVGVLPVGTLMLGRMASDRWKTFGLKPRDTLIYDWKAAKPVAILPGHSPGKDERNNWSKTAVSADGMTLLSVNQEGEALLFDLTPLYKK